MSSPQQPNEIKDFLSRLVAATLGVFLGAMLTWWFVAAMIRYDVPGAVREIRELRDR